MTTCTYIYCYCNHKHPYQVKYNDNTLLQDNSGTANKKIRFDDSDSDESSEASSNHETQSAADKVNIILADQNQRSFTYCHSFQRSFFPKLPKFLGKYSFAEDQMVLKVALFLGCNTFLSLWFFFL